MNAYVPILNAYVPILSAILQFKQECQKELTNPTIEDHVNTINQLNAKLIVNNNPILYGATVQAIVAVSGLIFAAAFKVLTLTSTILLVAVIASAAIQYYRHWHVTNHKITEAEQKCVRALLSEFNSEPQAEEITNKINPLFDKNFLEQTRTKQSEQTEYIRKSKWICYFPDDLTHFYSTLVVLKTFWGNLNIKDISKSQNWLKRPAYKKCLFLMAKMHTLPEDTVRSISKCLEKHLQQFWTPADTQDYSDSIKSLPIYS